MGRARCAVSAQPHMNPPGSGKRGRGAASPNPGGVPKANRNVSRYWKEEVIPSWVGVGVLSFGRVRSTAAPVSMFHETGQLFRDLLIASPAGKGTLPRR